MRSLIGLICLNNTNCYILGYNLGLDYVGYIFIYLRIWIIFIIIVARERVKILNNFHSVFIFVNLILLVRLIFRFRALNYLFFYIRFEVSLIPTLILILGWGYQPERIQAGVYMLFYTLTLSLPLLVSLLYIFYESGTLVINFNLKLLSQDFRRVIWYFSRVIAFLVKLPIYVFHLWLPKAHVEAPVAGSIILAGVLLKLGGYGLIRLLPMFQKMRIFYSWLWVSLSLWGGVVVSLLCLRQVDMKALIAYSSVVHISLVLCGLIIFRFWGFIGSVVVMVGHGLCSSGLFCLANIVYERLGRRSLLIRKGLLRFIPRIGLWWFLIRVGNIAAPPSLNLVGEVRLIIRLVRWRRLSILVLALVSFFGARYTLYIYSLSQHGVFFNSLYSCSSGKVREYCVLFLHWFPLNFLILNLNVVRG